jgi:integrase
MMTLLYTGIRAEELVGLLRRDLVDMNGVLSIRVIGKGDKQRIIPIYSEIKVAYGQLDGALERMADMEGSDEETQYKAAYASALLANPDAPLIPSLPRWGANARDVDPTTAALEPLSPSGLSAMIKKLASQARVFDKKIGKIRQLKKEEVERIHPHAFRHYAATAASEAGLPRREVQTLLGHEDPKTTDRYIRIDPKAVSEFGAYISRSRTGGVISPEEASSIYQQKRSVLVDESLEAAPAEDTLQKIKDQPRAMREAPKEPQKVPEGEVEIEETRQVVESPTWAYKPGSEKLNTYLPPGIDAKHVPKGRGYLLTFRVGAASALPFWAGRANRWKGTDLAPIISFYQAFAERDDVNIRDDLVEMFYDILESKGITAASAYSEWVQEVVGYASVQFFTTMSERGDAWIDFNQPAVSGQTGNVRMHNNTEILRWFEEHATSAAASVLRAPPQWDPWAGEIRGPFSVELIQGNPDIYKSVFRVQDLPNFREFFNPSDKSIDVEKFKGGTGKALRRVRFKKPNSKWMHAVILERKEDQVTILGDPLPDIVTAFEVSSEGKRKVAEKYHPIITAMKDLPNWFFDKDPLLSLPNDERKRMREWVESLQGTKKSKIRVISSAHELANTIRAWKDANKDLFFLRRDKGADQVRINALSDEINKLEALAREISEEQFGVTIEPKVIAGGAAEKFTQKKQSRESEVVEGELLAIGDDVEKQMEMKLPPLEKRIFAYIEFITGKKYDDKDIVLEPIIRESTGIFGSENIRWGSNNTIQHTPEFKRRFFVARGTDSECVVRRAVRSLWERKKAKDAKREKEGGLIAKHWPSPEIHRDIIMRHFTSLMAYLVPCPQQLEDDLRRLFEEAVRSRNYDNVPIPFRGILPMEGRPPTALSEEVFESDDLRQMWFDMLLGKGKKRSLLTKSEQRAEEIRRMFEGLEDFSEDEEGPESSPEMARMNSKLCGLMREILNPVTEILASAWPV